MAYTFIRTFGNVIIQEDSVTIWAIEPGHFPLKLQDGTIHILPRHKVPDTDVDSKALISFARTDVDWVNCSPSVAPDPANDNDAIDELVTNFWKNDAGSPLV